MYPAAFLRGALSGVSDPVPGAFFASAAETNEKKTPEPSGYDALLRKRDVDAKKLLRLFETFAFADSSTVADAERAEIALNLPSLKKSAERVAEEASDFAAVLPKIKDLFKEYETAKGLYLSTEELSI